MTNIDTQVLQDLLDITNVFRPAVGIEKLKALPFKTALPGNARECVLALAIDHECSVRYGVGYEEEEFGYPIHDDDFSYGGIVDFAASPDGVRDAKLLAEQLGVEPLVRKRWNAHQARYEPWYPLPRVPLPDRFTQVAMSFDDDDEGLRDVLTDIARQLWPWEFEEDEAEPDHAGPT